MIYSKSRKQNIHQGYLPAPQSPEGRRPWWIQSLFILETNLNAVIATSCSFSPNSNLCAKRWMYRQGSKKRRSIYSYNTLIPYLTLTAIIEYLLSNILFYKGLINPAQKKQSSWPNLLWASQRFIFFPLKTKQTKRELKAIEWAVTGYSHDIRIAFITH